jgi:hypothetical protein
VVGAVVAMVELTLALFPLHQAQQILEVEEEVLLL